MCISRVRLGGSSMNVSDAICTLIILMLSTEQYVFETQDCMLVHYRDAQK